MKTEPCPYCKKEIPSTGIFGFPSYDDVPENHDVSCPIREVMEVRIYSEKQIKKNKQNLSNWFDPHNIEHIKAYRQLQQTGTWPENFIPEFINIDSNFQISLAFKISNTWIEYMLLKNDIGGR